MILLGIWGRNYSSGGQLVAFPANAWSWYQANAIHLKPYFDGLQLPPAAITASKDAPNADGYGTFCYRDLDGTYWGNQAGLLSLIATCHTLKMKVYGDFPFRQMDGENSGPGRFAAREQ